MEFDFAALLHQGLTHHAAGRLAEAEGCYKTVLARINGQPDALHLLGVLRHQQGQADAAITLIRRAIAANPAAANYHANLATVLATLGVVSEAEEAARAALALDPNTLQARNDLADLAARSGRLAESIAHYSTSLATLPDQPEAAARLLLVAAGACDWDAADAAGAHLRHLVASGRPVQPFAFLLPDTSSAEQQAASRLVSTAIATAMAPLRQTLAFECPPCDQRLVIGYLSNDFRAHATLWLMAELFELHDKDRFRVVALSYSGPDDGVERRRVMAACDEFIDLTALSPAEAARRIHAAGIHVLVDLKGHVPGGRPEILALRPAPIQVAWLGYPGTMGAELVDYAVVDGIVVPADRQPSYDECLVTLPQCYQINDRHRPHPPRPERAALGLPDQAFVFCCFNHTYKITRPIFSLWMRLLAAVPHAVLWLPETSGEATATLRREAASRAIAPDRLIFAPYARHADHLARLAAADLFLDTLPYNAHTTASDALWMGLPVVTCTGEPFCARVATSLLHATGLGELATASLAEYEALALALARDPQRLVALRRQLDASRATARLFDSPATTRALETAFTQMWRRYCEGKRPLPFSVGF